jgi:hypothetical protein
MSRQVLPATVLDQQDYEMPKEVMRSHTSKNREYNTIQYNTIQYNTMANKRIKRQAMVHKTI